MSVLLHILSALYTRLAQSKVGAREAGMSTAEYAIGTLAACTFAALLIAIIKSPAIRNALSGLITTALGLGR